MRRPPWAYGVSSGKRVQMDIQLPQHCRMLPEWPTWSHLLGSLKESAGLDHWGSDRNGERVRAHSNQCSDLDEPRSCLQQHLSRDPRQWLCLHSQGWPYLAIEPFLSPSLGKEANLQPCPTAECSFQSLRLENLGCHRAHSIVQLMSTALSPH